MGAPWPIMQLFMQASSEANYATPKCFFSGKRLMVRQRLPLGNSKTFLKPFWRALLL